MATALGNCKQRPRLNYAGACRGIAIKGKRDEKSVLDLVNPTSARGRCLSGLERFGYENSPLEKMAYEAEKLFRDGSTRFDPEKYVAQ